MGTFFGLMYIIAYLPYFLAAAGIVIVITIIVFVAKKRKTKNEIHYPSENQLMNNTTSYITSNTASCGFRIGESFYTKVAGVTYNGVQSILPTLHAGMPLIFIREPYNQYDNNAIAIQCNGMNIGHLSADVVKDIAPLMDNGSQVEGEIVQITGGNGKTYGCNIEVTIYK